MADNFNQPGKVRFYIDATQFARASGNLSANQTFQNESTLVPAISAGNMFHNNPSASWTNEGTTGWMGGTEAEAFENDYEYDFEGEDQSFWMTDYCVRFTNQYDLININYMAFLGHNLGNAETWAEPLLQLTAMMERKKLARLEIEYY